MINMYLYSTFPTLHPAQKCFIININSLNPAKNEGKTKLLQFRIKECKVNKIKVG